MHQVIYSPHKSFKPHTRFARRLVLVAPITILIAAISMRPTEVRADSAVWNGGLDENGAAAWDIPANWNPNTTFPNGIDQIADLSKLDITGGVAPHLIKLNQAIKIGRLIIGDTNNTAFYNVVSGENGSLIFDVSTGAASILQTSTSGGDSISAALTLADSLVVTNESIANALTLSGVITESPGTTLTKRGAGGLVLAGFSSYAGDIIIDSGVLQANRSNNVTNPNTGALGNTGVHREIVVNSGGTLQFTASDTMGSARTVPAAMLVINRGGVVTNNGREFTTLGSVVLNGGTLANTGGATANYQAFYLNGWVYVEGTSASTIFSSGGDFGGYHLAAPSTFVVANATGNADADLIVSARLIDGPNPDGGAVRGGLMKYGEGTMQLSGNNAYTGVTAIYDGVLSVDTVADGGIESSLGASSGVASNLILDGGTLRYTGGAATTDRLFSIGRGGATFDSSGSGPIIFSKYGLITPYGESGARTLTLTGTNKGANTISEALLDYGEPTSVVKSGTGTWHLTGDHRYRGSTSILGGALYLGGDGNLGDVFVAGGATFGTKLQFEGDGGVVAKNVVFHNGSKVVFDVGRIGFPGMPFIETDTLTATGSVRIELSGGAVTSGKYRLFEYNELLGGGFSTFSLGTGGLPARTSAVLSHDTLWRSIDVTINADRPKWTGAVSGNWDADDGTGTGSTNWRLVTGGTITRYLQGGGGTDAVRFDDTATGTTTVNLTTTLTPALVTVFNRFNTYTFAGAGRLSGATTALIKQDTGTLLITNTGTNDFGGGTALKVGSITLGDGATAGAGTLGTGPVENDGTLTFNRPDEFTFGNLLTGSGRIIKQSTGTAFIDNPNNFYSGGTIVSAGTLSVSKLANGYAASNLGSSSNDAGNLVLAGGTLQYTGPAVTIDRLFTLGEGETGGTIDASGAGALVFSNTKRLAYLGNGSRTLTLTGTAIVGLNGSGEPTAANTLAAVLEDSGGATSVLKTGIGTWALKGINSYTGVTTVSEGALIIDGTVTGAVNTTAGATLAGNGHIGGTTNIAGGILSPGNGLGTLTTGSLFLDSESALKFELTAGNATIGGGINDLINVRFDLTLDGTLQISLLSGSTIENTAYTLFRYNGALTNNGLELDPSFLAVHPTAYVDTSTPGVVMLSVPEPTLLTMLMGAVGLLGSMRPFRPRRDMA